MLSAVPQPTTEVPVEVPEARTIAHRTPQPIASLAERKILELVKEIFESLLNQERVVESLASLYRRIDENEVSSVITMIAEYALAFAGVKTNPTKIEVVEALARSKMVVALKESYLHHASNEEDKVRILSVLVTSFTRENLNKYVFPNNKATLFRIEFQIQLLFFVNSATLRSRVTRDF